MRGPALDLRPSGSRCREGAGAAPADRAHLVSTITIGSQIEPPVGGHRKNSHDVVSVIRFGCSPGWPAVDGRGLVTGHLVDTSPQEQKFLGRKTVEGGV
jgi:hypothetical protein